jgi:hypothetical protein
MVMKKVSISLKSIITFWIVLTLTQSFFFTGTDSRVGFGFRFGEHADFQVQLELGPQIYTQTKYGMP